MQREGIYAPVYDLHVKYLAPLALNDRAVIHTAYVHHPGARLDYHYRVYRESDGVLCAEGDTVQLFIDESGELMLEEPAYYREWKERFLLSSGGK